MVPPARHRLNRTYVNDPRSTDGDVVSPQLRELLDELLRASLGFAALATAAPEDDWHRRPAEGSWSAAECVAHLNLTSDGYLPVLRLAIDEARALDVPAPRRYRRDPMGWLLWRMIGPPARMRLATSPTFVPTGNAPLSELLQRFEALQAEVAACIRDADGLPITRVRVQSPFDARVRYNLFSALSVVPRHQLRHLWQAERALAMGRGGRAGRRGTKSASSPARGNRTDHAEGEMQDHRNRDGNEQAPALRNERAGERSSNVEAPEEESRTTAANMAAGREQEDATGSSEGLETRLPLEPGDGPGAPQGDALLDGNGSRHGVDARDERPAGG